MLFESVALTWQFLAASLLLVGLHILVRHSGLQKALLAALNLLFIASFATRRDLAALAIGLILIHALARLVSLHPDRNTSRATLSLVVMLLLAWFVPSKYEPWQGWLNQWISGWQIRGDNSLLRGVGFSYLFFRALHYLVEIWRGSFAHAGIWGMTRYLTFFPSWASGPIERYDTFTSLNPSTNRPTVDDLSVGVYRIALGAVKRLLLLAPLVVWVQSGTDWGAALPRPIYLLAFGSLYYLYLYLDFSGFTDLAIGGARLSGYRLSENFRTPYLATNLADFWRRWHITLSFMVRDYLFKPLVHTGALQAMPRTAASILAYLAAFAVMGVWHGAHWYFAAWGLWHGCGLALRRLWLPLRPDAWKAAAVYQAFCYIITQLWVATGWVFFAWPLVFGGAL